MIGLCILPPPPDLRFEAWVWTPASNRDGKPERKRFPRLVDAKAWLMDKIESDTEEWGIVETIDGRETIICASDAVRERIHPAKDRCGSCGCPNPVHLDPEYGQLCDECIELIVQGEGEPAPDGSTFELFLEDEA